LCLCGFKTLETQPQAELELPGIEGGGRLGAETAFPESDGAEIARHSVYIHAIEKIECFRYQFETQLLPERDCPGHTQIHACKSRRHPGVAPNIPYLPESRQREISLQIHIRPVCTRLLIQIRVRARQYIEGPTR
jgi:hypothetical protein